ncbi:MAG: RHS repeat protein, partial [Gammaproteobacteria bacterium]|nr:RHS repeat protein [Gammaproteobacteria bacterium]
ITDTRDKTWSYDYTQLTLPASPFILSKVTDPDSRIVEQTAFDDLGRAISQTFRGEYVGITYHDDGRRSITDGLGRVMTHTYNSQLLLVGTTDALGQGESFALDENYNRTERRDKNNNPPTTYAKTEMGQTTAIMDALGNLTQFEYNDNNNLTQSIDAGGKVTKNLYDGRNNLISTTNALDQSTFYAYNTRGQVTTVTDANNNITRYGYDALGQRTVITNALDHVTRYEYDNLGRLVKTTDSQGKVTVNEYDDGDNLVKVIENAHPTETTQNYLNQYNLVTAYSYDGIGRRETTTDTLGQVKRIVYDDAGRLWRSIENEHPTETTQNYLNQYNLFTDFVYDEAGNITGVIDTLGRETRTEFDARNRIDRIIVNYVNGVYDSAVPDEDIITQYGYDANGNQISEIDPLGRESRTEYDELNRVKRTIVNYKDGVYDPAKPDEDLITSYTYDEVGNQKTVTDPLNRVTANTYDDLNRVLIITNPLSGTISYSYDAAGNKKTMTDTESRVTTYGYDDLNRAITVTNALSGQITTAFDETGNQVSATDAENRITRYGYDSLNRRTVITNALGQATYKEYDAGGRLVKTTDPKGQVTLNEFDTNDNLIRVTKNYLAGQPQNYQNEYNLVTEYAYDPTGQPTVIIDTLDRVTVREYDKGSRVTRQIVNDVDGVYNPAQPDEDIITRYSYDANSNILSSIDALNRE